MSYDRSTNGPAEDMPPTQGATPIGPITRTTRALFYVTDVLFRSAPDGTIEGQIVKLGAAYDPNPDSPNHAFWQATPSGQLEMTVNNPQVFDTFVRGQKFWLDFTPIEE